MSIRRFKVAVVALALAGMCMPTVGWTADDNVLPPPQISDVALRTGNVLVGQMVDGQNAPQSGVRVSLQDTQNREVGAAVTDRQGSFSIAGVRGGLYQIVTPQGRQVYRVWEPNTAPPAAQQGVLLISKGQTVRGAFDDNGNWYASPLCAGLVGLGAGVGIGYAVGYGQGTTHTPSSH